MAITYLSGGRIQGSSTSAGGRVGTGNGQFDGDDMLRWTDNGLTGDFTIAFWLNKQDTATYDTYFFKQKCGTSGGSSEEIQFGQQSSGVMEIWGGSAKVLESSFSMNTIEDEWHHWCLTGDGADWILYYDGVSIDTTSSGTATRGNTCSNNVALMGESAGMSNGYVDEFCIFNRELTAAEVLSLADGSKIPTDSSLNTSSSLRIYLPMDTTASSGLTNWYDDLSGQDVTITSLGDPTQGADYITDEKTTLVTAPPKCATFDGSNDQVTGLGNLMSGTGAWSLSIWLYHTGGTSGNDGVMSPDGSLEMMGYQGSSQKIWMRNSAATPIYSTSTLAEDTWYHVCATRSSGGAVKLYLNGSTSSGGTGTDSSSIATDSWRLGNTSGEYWGGSMIEFAVWNGRELAQADVDKIYNSGSPTRLPDAGLTTAYTTSLTGYYPMDTNFNKFSGTGGNNGSVSGATVGNATPATPVAQKSVLPANTIFEETDTRLYWWLQDSVWIGGISVAASNWTTLTSGNSVSGTTFTHNATGINIGTIPSVTVASGTIDFERNVTSTSNEHTTLIIGKGTTGYGASSNGDAHIEFYSNDSETDYCSLRFNAASSDSDTDENLILANHTANVNYYYRLTWKVNSDNTSTWIFARYTNKERTILSTLGADEITRTLNSSDTDQWEGASGSITSILMHHHTSSSVKTTSYDNICIYNGVALPQVTD